MAEPSIAKLTVVIPCFNEAGNVRRFRRDVFDVLRTLPFDVDYVLVDDGSKDETPAELDALRQEPFVTVVRHEKNRGLGAALRSGFAAARGDAIVALDADLTFSPSEISNLVAAYSGGVDCVIGSPFLGRLAGVPPIRRALSSGVNGIYRLLLSEPLTSCSGIFRLYRASRLKALDLMSASFDINAEIVVKLLRTGGRIVEVPATLTTRLYGLSKINVPREIKNHILMFGRIIGWHLQRPDSSAARK